MRLYITLLLIPLNHLLSFGQKIKLAFNLEQGKTYHHYSVSEISSKQIIQGQEFSMEISIEGGMEYRVINSNNESYDLGIRYTSIIMNMNIQGRSITWSSEKFEEGDERSKIMSKMLASMIKTPFQATIQKTGQITTISSVDSMIINSVESVLKEYISDEQQIAQAKKEMSKQFQKSFGKEALKGQIEQLTYIFPNKKVKKGEQWANQVSVSGQVSGVYDNLYELSDYDKNTATIKVSSTMKSNPEDAFQYNDGMLMKQDVQGSNVGKIIIDRHTGWILKSDMEITIKGHSYIKESQSSEETMKIPMSMIGTILTTAQEED